MKLKSPSYCYENLSFNRSGNRADRALRLHVLVVACYGTLLGDVGSCSAISGALPNSLASTVVRDESS